MVTIQVRDSETSKFRKFVVKYKTNIWYFNVSDLGKERMDFFLIGLDMPFEFIK